MAPRSQPYRVEWPLNAEQARNIDEMFERLFMDVRNDSIFPSKSANTVLRTDGTTLEFDKVALTTDVAGVLPVVNGGSGRASATAYGVLAGGTTATSAHQSVAAIGTLGQVLTSNGPGALPTFENASGGGADMTTVMTRVIIGI